MKKLRQRGAQAVEFALVLPFLILIIFAVLDFFLIAYNKAVITNASREAARRAILLSTAAWDEGAIRQVACRQLRNTLVSVGAPAISEDCSATTDPEIRVTPTSAPGFSEEVGVSIRYNVRGFTLGDWWHQGNGVRTVGSPFDVTATTRMSHE